MGVCYARDFTALEHCAHKWGLYQCFGESGNLGHDIIIITTNRNKLETLCSNSYKMCHYHKQVMKKQIYFYFIFLFFY